MSEVIVFETRRQLKIDQMKGIKGEMHVKLIIKLDEINYGDVAVKVVPLTAQMRKDNSGAVGKLLDAIGNLPENLIREIFESIPVAQKNEIIAAFAMEYKERILSKLNALSIQHKLGLKLADCSFDCNLNIMAEVSEIDYVSIVCRFLTAIRNKLLSMDGLVAMFRPAIQSASAEQLVGLLNRFIGDNKEAFLASLINKNQQNLIFAIEDAANKQNIRLKISFIILEV